MLSIYKREFGENTENVDCSTSSPPDTPGTASGKPCYFLSMQSNSGWVTADAELNCSRKTQAAASRKACEKKENSKELHKMFFAGLSSSNKKVIPFSPLWYFVLLFVLFPKHCMVASGEWLGMDEDRLK